MAFARARSAPDVDDPQGSAPSSLGRRVVATFVSPSALFAAFRDHAPWVAPLLISMAVGILVIALLPDETFTVGMEHAVNRRGVPVEITSDTATIARWERIRLAFGVVVTQPVIAGVIAGLLTLAFSILLRGEARYRQYLAVTTHSFLISAVGALIVLPLQLTYADPEIRLSPTLLLPGLADAGFVGRFLDGINLFSIWMLVVVALGVTAVNRRRSAALPIMLVLGLYLALVTTRAAIAG
ncbi:hypothetical protein BH23GEM3_BH23GEM3_02520 [soil metagenome]|nr:YIP1 family protein [Gemmatimonadota bacterium]